MADKNENREIALQLSGVKKMYKLGTIGGGTLQADLQSWWARKTGKDDPNTKIGQKARLVGQTFMALNGIDLTVYKGEALGIIGGNGAGKSTMLKLLSQVTAPTAGTIDLYGRVASMLEVGTGFNGEMTGRENVYMNGAILGMTKAEIDAKMENIIEFSEVRDFIDTPVKRYSSGMYVKLAFSVAAHLDSEIMIMDEVLAVGDMAFQKKCLNKMRSIAEKEGRTVLYVSHNMNTIRELCDRCIVLDKGMKIYDGEVEKAISVYLGTSGEINNHFDYTEAHHHNAVSDSQILIRSLDIVNSEDVRYDCGDNIELRLTCKANQSYEQVKFRLEFQYQDGSMGATMLSDKMVDFSLGEEKIVNLEVSTEHLTSGKYKVDIVTYMYDKMGNEVFVDGVYPGFCFEITDRINAYNPLLWLHQYWGHIHLQDVVIKE